MKKNEGKKIVNAMRTKLSTLSDSNEDKILTILSYTIFGLSFILLNSLYERNSSKKWKNKKNFNAFRVNSFFFDKYFFCVLI